MTRRVTARGTGRATAAPAARHRRSIGVIGAGRVGAVLAAALRDQGSHLAGVSGRSAASRTRIETLLPGVPVRRPADIAAAADVLLLAVPDDVLADLVTELAPRIRPGQFVIHTSGRHGMAPLMPAAQAGAAVAAVHPAMTFTGTDVDLDRLPGCVFGVTCNDSATPWAEAFVETLGGVPVSIAEENRTIYHAALAHGANHLVTLVAEAMDVMRAAGALDPAAVLSPLLHAALDNALAYGDAALTGPVMRGDVVTVEAHVRELATRAPHTLETYLALARTTVAHAVADGRLTPVRAEAIREVLEAAHEDAA